MFLIAMRISKKRLPQKKIIFTASVVVLIAACTLAYVFYASNQTEDQIGMIPDTSINFDPPTNEEKEEAERQKTASLEAYEASLNSSDEDVTPTAYISRVFQDPSGVNVRAIVGGTASGNCIVKLSMEGQQEITKAFPVVVSGSSYTCEDALIPIAEIPAYGTWEVTLIINKDGKESAPATSSVELTQL